MKTLTKKTLEENSEFYHDEIKKGKIFVYPTDTIYGIGCDATNSKAIEKIRELKKRDKKPFSIIVPNKTWILENCYIKESQKERLNLLPGPYTLILKLKNSKAIAKKSLVGEVDTIGIRIPKNWFAGFLAKEKIVFVTTSVNLSGEPPLTNPKDLKLKIDYLVNDGILENSPSKIINLVENKIIKRK